MPVDQPVQNTVEQQALHALQYLSDDDKKKVLEYIGNLVTLQKVKDDQASAT
jgi:hypothetical protein